MRAGLVVAFLGLVGCADGKLAGEELAAADSSALQPAFVPTWVKSIHGDPSVSDIVVGAQRSYIAGYWRTLLDFHDGDPRTFPDQSTAHPFLAAIDGNGVPIWLRSFSDDGFGPFFTRMAVTAEDDVIVVGSAGPNGDVGCGIIRPGDALGLPQGLVSRYAGATGLCMWTRVFVGTPEPDPDSPGALSDVIGVKVEPNGDLIIAGKFVGGLDFGDGVVLENHNIAAGQGFVARLDGRGHAIWARLLGNPDLRATSAANVDALTMDFLGNIYLMGRAGGAPLDLAGVKPDYAATANESFVLSLRGDGQFRWLYPRNDRERAESGNQNLRFDAIDVHGRVAVAGRFGGPFEFGGQTVGAGDEGLFVLDFGIDGHEHWAAVIGKDLIPGPPSLWGQAAPEAPDVVVDDANRVNMAAPIMGTNGDGFRQNQAFLAVLGSNDGSVLRANVVGESQFEIGVTRLAFQPGTGLRLLSLFTIGTARFGSKVVGTPLDRKLQLDWVYMNLTH